MLGGQDICGEIPDLEYKKYQIACWARQENNSYYQNIISVYIYSTREAFSSQFKGDSVDLFCATMKEYASAYNPESFYGRIIAWHGPSGAGKSKGVDALKDRVRRASSDRLYACLYW